MMTQREAGRAEALAMLEQSDLAGGLANLAGRTRQARQLQQISDRLRRRAFALLDRIEPVAPDIAAMSSDALLAELLA